VNEVTDGITEVANATDEQAASNEEVASMVDQSVAAAEQIATETGQISDEVLEQVAYIDDIDTALDELVTDIDSQAVAADD